MVTLVVVLVAVGALFWCAAPGALLQSALACSLPCSLADRFVQVLYEDATQNRMVEALNLFDEVCNSRYLLLALWCIRGCAASPRLRCALVVQVV